MKILHIECENIIKPYITARLCEVTGTVSRPCTIIILHAFASDILFSLCVSRLPGDSKFISAIDIGALVTLAFVRAAQFHILCISAALMRPSAGVNVYTTRMGLLCWIERSGFRGFYLTFWKLLLRKEARK